MRSTVLLISSLTLAGSLALVNAEETNPVPTSEEVAETVVTEAASDASETPEATASGSSDTPDAPSEATEAAEASEESPAETPEAAEQPSESSEPAPDSEPEAETPATTEDEASDTREDGESSERNADNAGADLSQPPSDGAAVYIIYPSDGAEVTSPVKVVFGLDGMGVAPAGVDVEKTGHHHLIVDGGDELPAAGEVMGDNVLHFGGGQTETDIELEPGEHTLQLILGDKEHKPFDPMLVSEKITITVK